MQVRFIGIIRFRAGKYHLKTERPAWDACYRNHHRMEKLAMILKMIVGIFSSDPALKVRDVALQKSHQ
tara:strand:- start:296 stop:499 length:204 start_codon:yes stop_codon:yes gene_type:complete